MRDWYNTKQTPRNGSSLAFAFLLFIVQQIMMNGLSIEIMQGAQKISLVMRNMYILTDDCKCSNVKL